MQYVVFWQIFKFECDNHQSLSFTLPFATGAKGKFSNTSQQQVQKKQGHVFYPQLSVKLIPPWWLFKATLKLFPSCILDSLCNILLSFILKIETHFSGSIIVSWVINEVKKCHRILVRRTWWWCLKGYMTGGGLAQPLAAIAQHSGSNLAQGGLFALIAPNSKVMWKQFVLCWGFSPTFVWVSHRNFQKVLLLLLIFGLNFESYYSIFQNVARGCA